jgi:two-component system, NtrC family, nitrogen regulation sensor histidine kinase NtrY
MRIAVFLSFLTGLGLLYALSQATSKTPMFAQNISLVLAANAALALVLVGIVVYQSWQLLHKIRRGVFGARMTLRLALIFGFMAVLPGVMVYGVSFWFLTRSIESWFDVRMESALSSGLTLGQGALDQMQRDLGKKAESLALTLADRPVSRHLAELNSIREAAAVQEAALYDQHGSLIGFAGTEKSDLMPTAPDSSVFWQVRQQQIYSRVEALPDGSLIVTAVAPVNLISLSEDMRFLQLTQPVPKAVSEDARRIETAFQEYKELALSRLGLKRLYGLSLTLALLLALLFTLSLSFLMSERFSAPLRALVRGTRAVAKGDFTLMHPVESRDELGALTRSFNRMTRQLAEAKSINEQNRYKLEQAKVYLESILSNLSSGVIVMDEDMRIHSINPEAARLLDINAELWTHRSLSDPATGTSMLGRLAPALLAAFREQTDDIWQQQLELSQDRVLLVRGNHLPEETGGGYVLVFDEITDLIEAQRSAAWGEVARRLAHEIKNPLTPIQLSAERIAQKFAQELPEKDRDKLVRATNTIVNQVAAMKSMVDAFAIYARSPSPEPKPLDLNALVREVLTLYESSPVHIEVELAENLPMVAGDGRLLRQVIHNLLQNSQDALEAREDARIRFSTFAKGAWICFTLEDNGPGMPKALMGRLFEPYVTTKQKGTGLGLPVVKKIVDEHKGRIEVSNLPEGGARITVCLPPTGDKS